MLAEKKKTTKTQVAMGFVIKYLYSEGTLPRQIEIRFLAALASHRI